jgi:hypothetical protein
MEFEEMKSVFSLTAMMFLLATTIVCPSARSQPADCSKVWYGPSIGSADMLQLFTNPTQWDSARSSIDVFQFLTHHVNSWPCMGGLCNSNTLDSFAQVQAFAKLDEWEIDICIEGAGILPQTPLGTPVDCSLEMQIAAQNAFNWTVDAIINVQDNGGTVRYIAIDEPIRRWYSPIYPPSDGPECKTENLAEIAAMVADFITLMNNAAPSIIVGQIILYPEVDVEGIKTYVAELENLGINLPFIHLDVHGLRIIDYAGPVYGRVTLAQVRADLLELETFLHAHNISFAPILIDLSFTTQLFLYGEYTDEVYYEGAIDWINEVNSAIGQPEHLIFESWARPQYSDTDLISVITPINLPENDTSIFSHTRLINEGSAIFNLPPPCCVAPLRGNVDFSDGEVIDISDLVYLVDYMFSGGPEPPCIDEADVDGAGGPSPIDIADLVYLVDYMFTGGPPPEECLRAAWQP